MGMVPIDIQNQGSWEQLLRGNYQQGVRILKSIMLQSELARQLAYDQSAVCVIYSAINYSNATSLLAKCMDEAGEPYGTQAFNTFCGVMGVAIKSTWAETCADTTAKAQISACWPLFKVIMSSPSLQTAFGAVVYTPELLIMACKNGDQASIPLGTEVTITLSQFTVGSTTFSGGPQTFEVVGIDHDIAPDGTALPLTLFTKHVVGNAGFVQNANSSNATTVLSWYTQNKNMFNALPQEIQAAAAPQVKRKIAVNGNSNALMDTTLPILLYREGDLFATRTYSVTAEFNACKQYPLYAQNKGTLIKKYADGAGSAAYWWECSPGEGNANDVCRVISSGSPNYNAANNSYGLCFGFCFARG